MTDQEGVDQINVVSASQDNLNVIDNDDFQDAQNLLAGTEHFDPSQQEAISAVDDAYKRNKVNSFLNRIKDDVSGLEEAMLDQVAPSIIDDHFHDVIDMVKSYNKAVGLYWMCLKTQLGTKLSNILWIRIELNISL